MTIRRFAAAMLAVFVLFASPALAFESREEMRLRYRDAVSVYLQESPYVSRASLEPPYEAAVLDDRAVSDALGMLNFLRGVAGLNEVSVSRIYMERCGHAAALLAALDYADHDAPKPDDMNDGFYEIAHAGTQGSNLARFNWMRPAMLPEGVQYFVRDDGEGNLSTLGHRRWALNPMMRATGFGLANSKSGMTYMTMYAHDMRSEGAHWNYVAWPASGCFPVEMMHTHLAWSVVLNPRVYDVESCEPVVSLVMEDSSIAFRFDCATGEGDGFCAFDTQPYGAGPCVIFRPDFDAVAFTDYVQNQKWTVIVSGLKYPGGEPTELCYTVEMASLYPQDAVAVEMDHTQVEIKKGDMYALNARVIPEYADDLTVAWSSSDPMIAEVDTNGLVTAVSVGQCDIRAANASGRTDVCSVTVTE